MNFQENPTQLARAIQSLGMDVAEAQKKGLHLLYASPVELQIDSIIVELFRTIEKGAIRRVVVDAVGDLIGAASDQQRLYGYLYALVQHFVVKRVATFLTLETTAEGGKPMEGQLSALSDAILGLAPRARWRHSPSHPAHHQGPRHQPRPQHAAAADHFQGRERRLMPGPLNPEDKRYAQFRKLTEVSRSLTYARTVDEVLRLTVDRAAEILESDKAVLMLTNAEGLLSVRAAHGLPELATERFGEPLSDTIMTRLQGLLGVDAQHFLGVPLVVGGEVTGILAVTLRCVAQGREEEEWLLSALADQAAVALEKSRLDETAEFRERLIGIVSHDLRNPISAVLLGATVLLRTERIWTSGRSGSWRGCSPSAERAARMIRDLLDYTQARLGGGIRLEKKLTDVHAVVRGVVEEMVVVHAERDIDLHQDGDARGECDSDRVAQIVGNLLSNAITYSPPGTPIRVHTSGQDEQVEGQVQGQVDPECSQPGRSHPPFAPRKYLRGNATGARRR